MVRTTYRGAGQQLGGGGEIYFSIPVDLDTERVQEVGQLGDLGYWAPGTAF